MAAVRANWTKIKKKCTGEDDVDFHDEFLPGLAYETVRKMLKGIVLIRLVTRLHAHVRGRRVPIGVLIKGVVVRVHGVGVGVRVILGVRLAHLA